MSNLIDRSAAAAQINALLASVSPNCSILFGEKDLRLVQSYRVHSRKTRLAICTLITQTGLTTRTARNLSAEWLFHNLAYLLHIRRISARDADLDYSGDLRRSVRLATTLLEKLHLY